MLASLNKGCSAMMIHRGFSTYAYILIIGILLGISSNYFYKYVEFETLIRVSVNVSIENSANTTTELHRLRLRRNWNNTIERYVVPNVVHYIWFIKTTQKSFTFINYLSIVSAYRVQKPTSIRLHCNYLPSGEWWEKIWRAVPITIVHREPPKTIHDQPLAHAYHQGDVAKMEILLENGGIYLDLDVLVINNLDPMRVFDATLGKEKPPKLIAGIMIAKREALFIRLMHESYRNNYLPNYWDFNCARVTYEIYRQRPDLVHVEPYKLTTPDWMDRGSLWNRVIDWEELYVIHVMAHDVSVQFTPESIKGLRSTFGEVTRHIYYGSSKIID